MMSNIPSAPKSVFVGREQELAQITTLDSEGPPVFVVHGVRGIGKTRLQDEAIRLLRAPSPYRGRALTFRIDCATLDKASYSKALLQRIHTQAREQLPDSWPDAEQTVGQIRIRLTELAREKGVYLFFDTTEVLQAEEDFWRWLETNLVAPLISAAQVRFVFSGRVPAPWRSYEVRRALRHIALSALPKEEAALTLLEDCLKLYNEHLDPAMVQAALPLLYEIAQGHPGLSEQLAQAAAPLLPEMGQQREELERVLRAEVVEPFIVRELYGGLEEPWPEILTWASVLDDFDAYTLEQYVHRLPGLAERVGGAPAHFYNRGIAEMRNRYALVWHSGQGYALQGVLREIVRRQFEKLHCGQFKQACRAAADTYTAFAQALQDEPEAARYREKAAHYERQIAGPNKEAAQ